MTTLDHRRQAIEALGYPPREAAFLACVSRHGGYFLRRQFAAAADVRQGDAVVQFTRRLLAAHHATCHTFARRTHVYHLASHALYGSDDARPGDRRRRPALAIKVRLMALDYVLSRPDLRFLAGERERLAYCDQLGLDRTLLPQQLVRPYRSGTTQQQYFPGPLVMALQGDAGDAPTLICAHIHDGGHSLGGFSTFLRRFGWMLAHVPRWRVVCVVDRERHLATARNLFARAFAVRADRTEAKHAPSDINDYLRLRRLYEREAWAELQTSGLNRYLDLRARIGDDLDPLYARWLAEGDRVFERHVEGSAERAHTQFEAVLLPHSYLAVDAVRAHF